MLSRNSYENYSITSLCNMGRTVDGVDYLFEEIEGPKEFACFTDLRVATH